MQNERSKNIIFQSFLYIHKSLEAKFRENSWQLLFDETLSS